MEKSVSVIVLTWIIMLVFPGCVDKEVAKSKMYSFEVKTWGFSGPSFEAFMYNTDLSTYPRDRRGGIQFEENTLYILKHEFTEVARVTDTLIVKLSDECVDSLYVLAYKYLSNFEIDNEIVIGKVHEYIWDGTNLSVTLAYNGKRMECSQYRLRGVSHTSVGGLELIEFINRRAPEKFRLY